jgi:hypothetical protein
LILAQVKSKNKNSRLSKKITKAKKGWIGVSMRQNSNPSTTQKKEKKDTIKEEMKNVRWRF